jgi:hypothetical protein
MVENAAIERLSAPGGLDASLRSVLVWCRRNNLQIDRRSCQFLKGAMIFKVPVPRYLGFDQRQDLNPILGCPLPQISGHGVRWGFIIGIAPFRN